MTRRIDRELLLGVLLALGLAGVTGWSVIRYQDASAAVQDAAADLSRCRTAAVRINALRNQPDIAATLEREDRQVPALVERAAKAAGFSAEDTVDTISTDRPRRAGESPFMESVTHLSLRRITLPQLVTFLDQMRELDPAIGIRNLRVTAPRGEESGDRWTAEATLVYLIYAPPPDPTTPGNPS